MTVSLFRTRERERILEIKIKINTVIPSRQRLFFDVEFISKIVFKMGRAKSEYLKYFKILTDNKSHTYMCKYCDLNIRMQPR